MKSWFRQFRRWQQWLTWPALGALGAAVVTASFHVSVVRPTQLELDVLQRQVAGLRAQHKLTGPAERQNPRLQLVRFYESFPAGTSAPNWLGRIHAAAEANHLELIQGDYRIISKGHEQLAQYQITLPLKGSYPNIRGFMNAVLSELPSVSLDNVAFERQKIGESSVEVTVRLTLYLRDGR